MSTTFRRDRLQRLAEKGKLVSTSSYHFDDMMGTSKTDKEMPVRLASTGHDFKENHCNVYASDFSGYGRAWLNPNGTVTLYVHSNCNYTFRILK